MDLLLLIKDHYFEECGGGDLILRCCSDVNNWIIYGF